jgi:hypothetical protein
MYFEAIYCKAVNSNVKIGITSPSPSRQLFLNKKRGVDNAKIF